MKNTHISIMICMIIISFTSAWSQVTLIANKSISIESVDKETLRNIYTLGSKNIGTVKVILFDVRDEGETKSNFYSYIGTTPEAIRKIWLRAKLTGTGEPPIPVSEDEICNKVANTPGSIGYVSASKAKNNVNVIMNLER